MTHKKEARIILPKFDNDGNPLSLLHRELSRTLCSLFGGCTVSDTMGFWIAPNGKLHEDHGLAYDVAVDDTAKSASDLESIALRFGRLARQEAMYLRLPDGTVSILDTSEVPATLAAE